MLFHRPIVFRACVRSALQDDAMGRERHLIRRDDQRVCSRRCASTIACSPGRKLQRGWDLLCLIGLEWIYLAIFLFMMESADIHNYGNADDDDDNDYNDKYLSNDDDA